MWYERLGVDGFQDAEKMIGDRMELKQSATAPLKHVKNQLELETKTLYFRALSQCVHETVFVNDVEKFVMIAYADGQKIKSISIELENVGVNRSQAAIRYMIRRYEVLWGIRQYTRRQLNRKVG